MENGHMPLSQNWQDCIDGETYKEENESIYDKRAVGYMGS